MWNFVLVYQKKCHPKTNFEFQTIFLVHLFYLFWIEEFEKLFLVKFMFSKKATKIDEIFTVDLLHTVKLTVKILSIFVTFSENVNFIWLKKWQTNFGIQSRELFQKKLIS